MFIESSLVFGPVHTNTESYSILSIIRYDSKILVSPHPFELSNLDNFGDNLTIGFPELSRSISSSVSFKPLYKAKSMAFSTASFLL